MVTMLIIAAKVKLLQKCYPMSIATDPPIGTEDSALKKVSQSAGEGEGSMAIALNGATFVKVVLLADQSVFHSTKKC